MDFVEWLYHTYSDKEVAKFQDQNAISCMRRAYNANPQRISQRECYLRGHGAGRKAGLEEAADFCSGIDGWFEENIRALIND